MDAPTNRKKRWGGERRFKPRRFRHGRRGGGGRRGTRQSYAGRVAGRLDVANVSLFGYNPLKNFTGRAPLEAAAVGVSLGPDDWAARCNLVTIEDQVMRSFRRAIFRRPRRRNSCKRSRTAGRRGIPIRARRQLPQFARLSRPGASGAVFDRHLRHAASRLDRRIRIGRISPRTGQRFAEPPDEQEHNLFADHPVNRSRRAKGLPPATAVWLWGLGSTPRLAPFAQVYGKQGAIIAGVNLLRGLASLVGWRRIDVPGTTGYFDTDYAAKGRYAVAALDEVDLICVHIESPDKAADLGDAAEKVKALEEIDRPMWSAARGVAAARAVSHFDLARPSHVAADQGRTLTATFPSRSRAAIFHRRRRRLRRTDRRPFPAGVSTKAGGSWVSSWDVKSSRPGE